RQASPRQGKRHSDCDRTLMNSNSVCDGDVNKRGVYQRKMRATEHLNPGKSGVVISSSYLKITAGSSVPFCKRYTSMARVSASTIQYSATPYLAYNCRFTTRSRATFELPR